MLGHQSDSDAFEDSLRDSGQLSSALHYDLRRRAEGVSFFALWATENRGARVAWVGST